MGFWIFMTLMNMVMPLMMIGFGVSFMKRPPQKINGIYGYRTTMSMKNQDTWKFAHEYCGKLWYRTGWGMLVISLLIMFALLPSDEMFIDSCTGILCAIQCVVIIGTILPVEKALRDKFDKNGIRK